MSADSVTFTVNLPRDTYRTIYRIAAMAGVSPEAVIKVAMARRVVVEEQQPALTPWFAATTMPARPGVYQRRLPERSFGHWDGTRWGMCAASPYAAFRVRNHESLIQRAGWRGLAEEPTP